MFVYNILNILAFFLFSRAAAHSKMNANDKAIEDCNAAINIDPTYSKAFGRKGFTHMIILDINQCLNNIILYIICLPTFTQSPHPLITPLSTPPSSQIQGI